VPSGSGIHALETKRKEVLNHLQDSRENSTNGKILPSGFLVEGGDEARFWRTDLP
jgi:hypothetical protein